MNESLKDLEAQYEAVREQRLSLDLTRGKPSAEQLALSNALQDALTEEELTGTGTDLRNYGGLEGIPAARRLGAEVLGLRPDEVIVGGNASLTLMYRAAAFATFFGPAEGVPPWSQGRATFICPVPGYDRHFAICEELGLHMVTVPMTEAGPDMNTVERLLAEDASIRGMWCVPKYSNPDGCVYSAETVERIARLRLVADRGFRVFWDNAYAVHDLTDDPPALANVMDRCREHGTEDSILQFASTSKITFAGAGISWMGASPRNLKSYLGHLAIITIGPDKVNQARHLRFLPTLHAVRDHMAKHAAVVKPRFDCVLDKLERALGPDYGSWTKPRGGYFVSFDARPGLASEIVRLAGEVGVKLTPAGSTFPHKQDPEDKNLRIAPTYPTLAELDKAMDVFVLCVKLATLRNEA